jgi:DEAD/DEAH box helicase domain-containing protein
VLLAREDPLEAFLTRDPEQIVGRAVERVAVPTRNPTVCRAQLACAAYEAPISEDEVAEFGPGYIAALAEAAGLGELAPAGGRWIYPSHTSPAVQVSIRGLPGGDVTLAADGEVIGTMESWRARRYAHEGAVYLHRGDTFLVRSLDSLCSTGPTRRGSRGRSLSRSSSRSSRSRPTLGSGLSPPGSRPP